MRLKRTQDDLGQAFATAPVQMLQQLAAHAWIPELADVRGYTFQRFVAIGHRLKEVTDPVREMH
jgi:hypothetical protein